MDLRVRWLDLWRTSRAHGDGAAHGTALIAAWHEGHRHYHAASHLIRCLTDWDRWRHLASHAAAVEWALWFHDAIYDTSRSDNEERCARWASQVCAEAGLAWGDTVAALIAATAHRGEPTTPDACLLVDLDLEILSADTSTYDTYAAAIRREYQSVPDADFRRGRSAVLRTFLQRPRIYTTPALHDLRELPARKNLQRELRTLDETA